MIEPSWRLENCSHWSSTGVRKEIVIPVDNSGCVRRLTRARHCLQACREESPGHRACFPRMCPRAPGGSWGQLGAVLLPRLYRRGACRFPLGSCQNPTLRHKRVSGRVSIDSGFCVNRIRSSSPNTRSIRVNKAPRRVGNCWKRCGQERGSVAVQNGLESRDVQIQAQLCRHPCTSVRLPHSPACSEGSPGDLALL